MKKPIILVLVLCLLIPSAVMAASNKGFKVAVSNSFITHSWRTQMVNDLQKRVALYEGKGWISDFQIQHAGPDVDLQRSHIQNFIDSGVDILIIDPVSLTALNPVIEDAVDAGIVTVISDEPVTSKAPYVVLPTHDVWMEKLAKYVFNRMGGKGNVVYLSGIDGAPASDMRDRGFERALKQYPNINLLAKVFGSWDPALAQQAMADALAAYPKIDGVVAHDGQCLSVIRAFEAANRPQPVVNGSGFRPFFEYWVKNLSKGFTSYAIANGPGNAITIALGVGVRIKMGKKPKPGVWDGKVLKVDHANIITDANVKKVLEEHVRYRGVEDYIDEVRSEEFMDSLFQ
jgi:ribose transport system substrate-binding protein